MFNTKLLEQNNLIMTTYHTVFNALPSDTVVSYSQLKDDLGKVLLIYFKESLTKLLFEKKT